MGLEFATLVRLYMTPLLARRDRGWFLLVTFSYNEMPLLRSSIMVSSSNKMPCPTELEFVMSW